MKKIKYIRTNDNLIFNIILTQNSRSLGLSSSEDISDNVLISNGVIYDTDSRLGEIISFDVDNPYIVGVNGVTSIKDNIIKYTINEDEYTTDLNTNKTKVIKKFKITNYKNKNIFYGNKIGLDNKVKSLNTVNIDRNNLSVIDKFSKLKNVSSVIDVELLDGTFYNIINQTV